MTVRFFEGQYQEILSIKVLNRENFDSEFFYTIKAYQGLGKIFFSIFDVFRWQLSINRIYSMHSAFA